MENNFSIHFKMNSIVLPPIPVMTQDRYEGNMPSDGLLYKVILPPRPSRQPDIFL